MQRTMATLAAMLAILIHTGCATGVGRKISDDELTSVRVGKTTRDEVHHNFGSPIAQLNREGLECDSYTYTGVVNYFVFTKQDKAQSFNFCYDSKGVVAKKDGIQM
jgi:hypothetical protein